MLLALDTSTSYASIALVHDGRTLVELDWEVGRNHSAELLTRLDWLLAERGITPARLDGIAVATGPGSFNGVRVAVAAAKSLAFALGVPLSGHPTLDVIAWGAAQARGAICALLEAGRGQVYTASYAGPALAAEGWAPTGAYTILTPAELASALASTICEPVVFCGEWRPETRAALAEALGETARFSPVGGGRRASWLADLALARLARGERDAPEALEPLYLRRPHITNSAKAAPRLAERDGAREDAAQAAPEAPGGEGASRAIPS